MGVPLAAQERDELHDGSAVIVVDDSEYTIPILCHSATDVMAGFFTQANRITREQTGRSSMVNLRLDPTDHDNEVRVQLDRYVAWVSVNGAANPYAVTLDLANSMDVSAGTPKPVTREDWYNGTRPEGLEGVQIEARCDQRDPEAPKFRKIPS